MANSEITIKNGKLNSLLSALRSLDGRKEPIEINHPQKGTQVLLNMVPYTFNARTIFAIATNIKALELAGETLRETADKIREAIKNDEQYKNDEQRQAAYSEQMQPIFDEEVTVSIRPIELAGLEIEKNKLPPTVISELFPIINE